MERRQRNHKGAAEQMKFCCIRSNEINWWMSCPSMADQMNKCSDELIIPSIASSSCARAINEWSRIREYRRILKRVNRISTVQNV
ncbi:unnamed protein product [Eruca vesicaria subsp. sativa]|uniref:Uncharacterized protein n=1 Tax=Eruca vesicaria subsp. sativa TaxID=29727 RepID=A0ABC8LYI2_ERUVS|nr:unnamed protein product [Eruca vesicaria subsp. sativa]